MSDDLIVQLRQYSTELLEAAPPVEELVPEEGSAPVVVGQGSGVPRRNRRRSWVFAAAVVVVLSLGVLPLLTLLSGDDRPVSVGDVLAELDSLTIADLQAVRMEIAVDSRLSEGLAVVELFYVPDTGFRLEYLQGNADNPTGSYFAWDGSSFGFFRNEPESDGGPMGFRIQDPAPVYPPSWQSGLAGDCPNGRVTLIGTDVIAGRAVTGLHCAPLRGDHAIWVDVETGLILRLEGSYSVGGEVAIALAQDGSLEVRELTVDPDVPAGVFDLSALPVPPAQQVLLTAPPFRAVIERSVTTDEVGDRLGTYDVTFEVLYSTPDRWRVSVLAGSGPQSNFLEPGSYLVQSGGRQGWYDAGTGRASISSQPAGFPDMVHDLAAAGQYDADSATVSCTDTGRDVFIGRDVETRSCFVSGTSVHGVLKIDVETGLVLYVSYVEGGAFEVVELELDPEFAADAFELPDDSTRPVHPLVGLPAPELQMPLVGGEPFDLKNYAGTRTAVLFWGGAWCEPCLDALEELQSAQSLLGDEMAFVAVASSDSRSVVADVIARAGLTMPVPFDEDGSLIQAWRMPGIPALYLVDPAGVIVDAFFGNEFLGNTLGWLTSAPW